MPQRVSTPTTDRSRKSSCASALPDGLRLYGWHRHVGDCEARSYRGKLMPRLSHPHPFQALEPRRRSGHLHGHLRLSLTVKFPFPTHASDDRGGM
jgi:hypothetical protein